MSDLIVNIRIGMWHFQLTNKWKPRIKYNKVHKGYPSGRWAVYELFGWTLTKYGWQRTNLYPPQLMEEKKIEKYTPMQIKRMIEIAMMTFVAGEDNSWKCDHNLKILHKSIDDQLNKEKV